MLGFMVGLLAAFAAIIVCFIGLENFRRRGCLLGRHRYFCKDGKATCVTCGHEDIYSGSSNA